MTTQLILLSCLVPPHGADDIQELQSIFEISHLRSHAQFLDIQCMCFFIPASYFISFFLDRMPPHIGDFISDAVYDGQLRSNPEHEVQDEACWFVDVEGVEKRNGTSWEVCHLI